MPWFSILPASFAIVETWVVRFFLVLATIAIGPWLLLIVYDIILYLFRTATYEIPYFGGRARNRPRPRAPSLSERPSGKPRRFNLTAPGVPVVEIREGAVEGLKQCFDRPTNERSMSNAVKDQ